MAFHPHTQMERLSQPFRFLPMISLRVLKYYDVWCIQIRASTVLGAYMLGRADSKSNVSNNLKPKEPP
jgi:hypothetical protein